LEFNLGLAPAGWLGLNKLKLELRAKAPNIYITRLCLAQARKKSALSLGVRFWVSKST
jgi:hypothetical protein